MSVLSLLPDSTRTHVIAAREYQKIGLPRCFASIGSPFFRVPPGISDLDSYFAHPNGEIGLLCIDRHSPGREEQDQSGNSSLIEPGKASSEVQSVLFLSQKRRVGVGPISELPK